MGPKAIDWDFNKRAHRYTYTPREEGRVKMEEDIAIV